LPAGKQFHGRPLPLLSRFLTHSPVHAHGRRRCRQAWCPPPSYAYSEVRGWSMGRRADARPFPVRWGPFPPRVDHVPFEDDGSAIRPPWRGVPWPRLARRRPVHPPVRGDPPPPKGPPEEAVRPFTRYGGTPPSPSCPPGPTEHGVRPRRSRSKAPPPTHCRSPRRSQPLAPVLTPARWRLRTNLPKKPEGHRAPRRRSSIQPASLKHWSLPCRWTMRAPARRRCRRRPKSGGHVDFLWAWPRTLRRRSQVQPVPPGFPSRPSEATAGGWSRSPADHVVRRTWTSTPPARSGPRIDSNVVAGRGFFSARWGADPATTLGARGPRRLTPFARGPDE